MNRNGVLVVFNDDQNSLAVSNSPKTLFVNKVMLGRSAAIRGMTEDELTKQAIQMDNHIQDCVNNTAKQIKAENEHKIHAGLRVVGKRIDKAVKRLESAAKRPKKPSAAQLVRAYKLQKGMGL